MNNHSWKLIKIARKISKDDPVLGYDLENQVRDFIAVRNPGVSNFEQNLESMVTVLKSLKQELGDSLSQFEKDPDAGEFAKFFENETAAEEEELRRLLKKIKTSAVHIAGPKDWLKNLFKGKKKVDEEPGGMQPSYKMDDSTMDEFVEGKRDWADPSHYIEQEMVEHKDFFSGADKVLNDMKGLRQKPSKDAIQSLLKTVDRLIRHGESMMKGVRKHLLEPAGQVDTTDDSAGSKPTVKEKLSPEKLENTVEHYADMLKESLGDEKKTVKFLKELFDAVGPSINSDKASLASVKTKLLPVLVRTAHSVPKVRPVLLPVILRMSSVQL